MREKIIERFIQLKNQFNQQNLELIDEIVLQNFINDDQSSIIGTGIEDWYYGTEGLKNFFKEYFINKNKFLKNIELDLDYLTIIEEDTVCCVALKGYSHIKMGEEELYNQTINEMVELFNKNLHTAKEDLMKISANISRVLYEKNKTLDFKWPIRITAIMTQMNSNYLFKHIAFSFGANNGYDTHFSNENIDLKYKTIPIKQINTPEVKAIKDILKVYQKGYTERDLTYLNVFCDKVFTNQQDMIIFGTDEGELFKGVDSGKEITKLDWIYWGSFNLNLENAYIDVINDLAFVSSKAFLRKDHPVQNTYDSLKELLIDYLLPSNQPKLETLLTMLWKTNKRLLDASQGEVYIIPMKYIAVLVKREDKWRIAHMHFSDHIDTLPECRI